MEGAGGVTAIDTRVAAVTVSTAGAEVTAPEVAVMLLAPVFAPVARPLLPDALETVATEVLDDDHVAVVVRSWVGWAERGAGAANCWVVPLAMEAAGGVTAIDTRVAAVTVSTAGAEVTAPEVAVMLVAPVLAPVASPSDPEALEMEATLGFDELQVAVVVRSWV